MPEPLTVQIARLAVDGGKLLGAIEKRGAFLHHAEQLHEEAVWVP